MVISSNPEAHLLTPKQVASILNVSMRTVYRWLQLGYLTAFKLGEQWRIDPKDLEVFLKLRRQA